METHIQFTTSMIIPPPMQLASRETGACVEFSGIVREMENGKPISSFVYEAHETMARHQLEKIFNELSKAHPCSAVWLIHRLGVVPVGETSLYVRVLAQHRQPAFNLVAQLIDRLKTDVPIWKNS